MKFYLGTHQPQWLERTTTPLFISEKRLEGRKSFPRARGAWALDSGGFSQLSQYAGWPEGSERMYVQHVSNYAQAIGWQWNTTARRWGIRLDKEGLYYHKPAGLEVWRAAVVWIWVAGRCYRLRTPFFPGKLHA